MASFLDLPVDLLPLILQHLVRPTHIAQVCLVNKDFYTFSVRQLYRRVFIYAWHTNVKIKFVKLFQTLATSSVLAQYVEELTIRDFPRALLLGERNEVLRVCLRGIQNCINLQACAWTRDGSLSDDILQALCRLPLFTSLEINGNNVWRYSPKTLPKFDRLQKLSLIMPGAPVVEVLPQWLSQTGATLQRLTFLCQSSPRINDELLGRVASHLSNLEHLHLLGCTKVTHEGLWEVVVRNSRGLLSLGLEALSPAFDMAIFSERCRNSDVLDHLKSVTLTVNQHIDLPSWMNNVLDMLESCPLEMFHISTAGGDVGRTLTDAFVKQLVSSHGHRLKRFSVQRIPISTTAIEDICLRCPVLQELFVVVDIDDIDNIGPCLGITRNLRSLHINRPIESSADDIPYVKPERIVALVRQSGSELRQIGFSTRVWSNATYSRRPAANWSRSQY